MTTALRFEDMLAAAKVPAEKARTMAEAMTKSLKEDFVTHADLKLSHQDVMHAVKTLETNLTHKIEKAFLRSTVALGSVLVVGLGLFFAALKAFP